MGKKHPSKVDKRKFGDEADEGEEQEAEAELQAELAALMDMQEEKRMKLSNSESGFPKVIDEDRSQVSAGTTNYNAEGMKKCLGDIDSVNFPFIETMIVSEFGVAVQNENDDIEREMAFYNQSLSSMIFGRDQLSSLGVPTRKPVDYFCEHVKTDAHMAKIKDRLLIEEKRIEAFELRKNREQNKKFNKQVSQLKKQEKSQKQKQQINEVTELRKGTSSSAGINREEKLNRILEDGGDAGKSKKRKAMDKKYGFGGKDRKQMKLADKKSLNDMTEFNPRGGKFVRRGSSSGGRGGGRGGGGGGKQQRPGKDARQKRRTGSSS